MIKKMMLVLISANILSHTASITESTDDNGDSASVVIKAVLGYSIHTSANDMPMYAMFDDLYWSRVKTI